MQSDGGSDQTWARLAFLVSELFIALTIIFMVANSVGTRPPPPNPTPTPPPTPTLAPTPTPAPVVCGLESTYYHYQVFSVDFVGILNGVPQAGANFIANLQSITGVKTDKDGNDTGQVTDDVFGNEQRVAGLVEVLGGGRDNGLDIARQIRGLLQSSGLSPIKDRTIYQVFFLDGGDPTVVSLNVFYFVRAAVCNS